MHTGLKGTAPAPLEESVDHIRGPDGARVILECSDYECPYSRTEFREIERADREVDGGARFAFRDFPLTEIHPHALAAVARRGADPCGASLSHRGRGCRVSLVG